MVIIVSSTLKGQTEPIWYCQSILHHGCHSAIHATPWKVCLIESSGGDDGPDRSSQLGLKKHKDFFQLHVLDLLSRYLAKLYGNGMRLLEPLYA